MKQGAGRLDDEVAALAFAKITHKILWVSVGTLSSQDDHSKPCVCHGVKNVPRIYVTQARGEYDEICPLASLF